MNLRELRLARGYTLHQLSELSGVSLMYISELERGTKKNPSAQVLVNLAKSLDVPITTLLYGNETNPK